MAPHAISITKRVPWRGVNEEFSNVYHYDISTPITTEGGWDDLINAIVAQERPLHYSGITYVRGRVWGPTNAGPAASITKRIMDLSGAGTAPATGSLLPPEHSVVVQFYMGRNPATQRKTFLRKFFHCGRVISSTGTPVAFAEAALSAADKAPFETRMNNLKTLSVGGFSHDLCKPDGTHLPLGSSPEVLSFVRTRQFRQ